MNERTHFFIKIYLSHFILDRVMFLVCERWVGDGDRLPHILTIAALLSHLGWAAQPWVTEGPKPSVCRWFSRGHLVPQLTSAATGTATRIPTWTATDWLKPSVAPGYIFVWRPPASCGRTHLPPSPNLTTSTGQGDIPISSTGCTCFAVLPLIYIGASLDWQLGRGSICYRPVSTPRLKKSVLSYFTHVQRGWCSFN